jgi:hypothetical protein
MAFGDPEQQRHMMDGVRRAYASSKTPQHLRPHLAARLGGGTMQQMPPRKTIVGPTGRTPIKPVVAGGTARYNARPNKDIVGNTQRPLVKDVVGNIQRPPIKTQVGSTAAPPLKTMPGSLGTGGNGPRPGGELDRSPLGSASPSQNMRSLGRGDGNMGRSVPSMPGPANGPPNPVLDFSPQEASDDSSIQAGGMGQTRINLSKLRPAAQRRRPRAPRNAFYGE